MKTFTLNELENAFEMGCIVQNMIQDGVIDVGSKEAFNFALPLVTEFEHIGPSADYYYEDIDRFTVYKFMNAFAMEE